MTPDQLAEIRADSRAEARAELIRNPPPPLVPGEYATVLGTLLHAGSGNEAGKPARDEARRKAAA